MCAHCWKRVNDVWFCVNCGLTRTLDGRILFDKNIVNYKPKKKKRKARRKL